MGKHDRHAMIEALKPAINDVFGPCRVEPMDLGMKYAVFADAEADEVLHVGSRLGRILFSKIAPGRGIYLVECPTHILSDWIE